MASSHEQQPSRSHDAETVTVPGNRPGNPFTAFLRPAIKRAYARPHNQATSRASARNLAGRIIAIADARRASLNNFMTAILAVVGETLIVLDGEITQGEVQRGTLLTSEQRLEGFIQRVREAHAACLGCVEPSAIQHPPTQNREIN